MQGIAKGAVMLYEVSFFLGVNTQNQEHLVIPVLLLLRIAVTLQLAWDLNIWLGPNKSVCWLLFPLVCPDICGRDQSKSIKINQIQSKSSLRIECGRGTFKNVSEVTNTHLFIFIEVSPRARTEIDLYPWAFKSAGPRLSQMKQNAVKNFKCAFNTSSSYWCLGANLSFLFLSFQLHPAVSVCVCMCVCACVWACVCMVCLCICVCVCVWACVHGVCAYA